MDEHRDLVIRIVLGSPCLGLAGWFMCADANPYIGLWGALPCFLAFGLIVFPSSTAAAGRLVSQIVMPEQEAAPRPHTSRAEALRFHGEPVEALVEYRRVLRDFPHELRIWHACFEIAWTELQDREIAAELHRLALRATDHPDQWKRLDHLYLLQARRHPDFERWAEEETAAMDRRSRHRQWVHSRG